VRGGDKREGFEKRGYNWWLWVRFFPPKADQPLAEIIPLSTATDVKKKPELHEKF